eukprot:335101_1
MDDILEHIMIVDHSVEGNQPVHPNHAILPPKTRRIHSASADRVHSRIPNTPKQSGHRKQNSKIPASFVAYKRKKAENDRIMNGDIDSNQLLWNKYLATHGLPQNEEQFMSFCKQRGHNIDYVDTLQLMEMHHVHELNELHHHESESKQTE